MLERRIVTVLFADVVGFTPLSERFDVEDVATIQERFFTQMSGVIELYGGEVQGFIGDAVLGIFGVPRAADDDAIRAVRAGVALHSAVAALDAELGLEAGTLVLRVGLNTGEVAYETEAKRVTGDSVNVAARLQVSAEPGSVLIGEETALAVADATVLEPVGALDLKGKSEPVRAWKTIELRPEPSRTAALGRLRAPMVGREAELAILLGALDTIDRGPARILVVAPPGVGKTRLLREFVERVRTRGEASSVWASRATPGGSFDIVSQLFTVALRLAAPATSLDGPHATATARSILLERLRRAPARLPAEEITDEVMRLLAGDARTDLGDDREARFGAWLTALEELEEGPHALWLIEDVHLAGADGRAFLDAAASRDAQRLVVATARPDLLARDPEWCQNGASLHLKGLAPSGVTELVRAHVGNALPETVVEAIAGRADGNPLFVEELLRTWLSTGVLAEGPDGFVLRRDPGSIVVPTTVRALYAAQLDDLPPAGRAVARRASVIGRSFSVAALQAVDTEVDLTGISTLRERTLIDGPFVEEHGESYHYRHSVLQETAYRTLTRAERAVLHVRLATWLAAGVDEPREELAAAIADHFTAGLTEAPSLAIEIDVLVRDDVHRHAIEWRLVAAQLALRRTAYAAALDHAEALTELLGDDDGFAAAEADRIIGTATAALQDLEAGATALVSAAERFERLLDGTIADPDRARTVDGYARTIERLVNVRYDQLEFELGSHLAGNALRLLDGAPDPVRARVALAEARAVGGWLGSGAPDAVRERALWAAEVASDQGDLELRFAAAWALDELGVDEGPERDPVGDVETLARRLGRWNDYLQARTIRLFDVLVADSRAAREHAQEDIEVATSFGLSGAAAWAWYRMTEVDLAGGDWAQLDVAAGEALRYADRHGVHRAAVRTWFTIAPVAAARGDEVGLQRLRDWFADHDDVLPARPGSEYGRVMIAGLRLHAGQDLAVDLPSPTVSDLAAGFGMPSWQSAREAVIDAWLTAGRVADVAAIIEAISAESGGQTLVASSASLVDAWYRVAIADADAAVTAARAALDAATTCVAPWWASRAIRVLEALGAATPGDVEQRVGLERALGIRPTPP